MPHYFLHIYNGSGFVEDEEGLELPGLDEARKKAVEGIRSLLAGELLDGSIDLRGRIEIAAADGKRLAVVPFRSTVAVIEDESGQ